MFEDVWEGFSGAILKIIAGIVLSALLSVVFEIIPTIPNIPSYFVGLFRLLEIIFFVGGILVIMKFESWGFCYLGGWLFGMWIMSYLGFVENWLLMLYVTVGIVVLITKILKKLGEI